MDEDPPEEAAVDARRLPPLELVLRVLTGMAIAFVAVVPIVGNELRVQDVDPVYMRNLVERAETFGGTYFQNAIHNRGTFEPLLYDLAGRLTSYDGFWFAISALVAVLAAVLAWGAARTAQAAGANRSVALGVAVVAYVQLTLADHGYSRVLYIRNITTTLLVLVWVLALSDRWWAGPRRARAASITTGALLGLVAEQLLTSVVAGAVVGLVALALLREHRPREERTRHLLSAVAAAVVAFAATPLWYVARGSFAEYWSGWWTYARYMGDGPGRSIRSQLRLGWDQAWAYHVANPMVVALLGGFAVLTWLLWHRLERRMRIVHLGLLAWYLAGWVELTFSQRYSPHYYQVIAVPTVLLGATLAGHAATAVARIRPATRWSLAVPLLALVVGLFMTGPAIFVKSVEDTKRFDGVAAWARQREKLQGGGDRTVRSILDLVSERDDALLAWTFDPFVYTRYQRTPATRFQWKFLLQGSIYLGRTSPDYVLPDTWRWFDEDVAETHPVAFAETEDFSSGLPFERLVRADFERSYVGTATNVWLRHDVARSLLDAPARTRPWADPGGRLAGTGWSVSGPGATYAAALVGAPRDPLTLGQGECWRLDGTLDVPDAGVFPDLVLRFDDPSDADEEPQDLALQGGSGGSGSAGLGPLGFESSPVALPGDGPVAFAVIVGDSSAALVVDHRLVGAVRLPDGVDRLQLEPRTAHLDLRDLRVGSAPGGGGCAPLDAAGAG